MGKGKIAGFQKLVLSGSKRVGIFLVKGNTRQLEALERLYRFTGLIFL